MKIKPHKRKGGPKPFIYSEKKAASDSGPILCGSLGRIEKVEHDLNFEHVTPEDFRAARDFIHACEKVGVWRLKQNELTEDAGFYIAEIASRLTSTIRVLIEEGDLMLARKLPSFANELEAALNIYGSKISSRVTKRSPIDQILQKKKARELLQMVSVLHPDWHSLLHITDRHAIELLSEKQLHQLLLSKECWVNESNGNRTEESRKHRLAEIIENIIAVREGENENINLFVEHLWHGWLWSGPTQTFTKCHWNAKKSLPARNNIKAWMKIIMPFLRQITQGDAMKLTVFSYMLAARKRVFAGERLADDKPEYIWNQIENRIRKAWKTMDTRARKRNCAKLA